MGLRGQISNCASSHLGKNLCAGVHCMMSFAFDPKRMGAAPNVCMTKEQPLSAVAARTRKASQDTLNARRSAHSSAIILLYITISLPSFMLSTRCNPRYNQSSRITLHTSMQNVRCRISCWPIHAVWLRRNLMQQSTCLEELRNRASDSPISLRWLSPL